MKDYTIFDLETTGLGVSRLEIIEIGALRVRNGEVTDTFQQLIKPKRPIDARSTAINHITNDMVRDCPPVEDVLPLFAEFIGNDILVGHNINRFDMPIIKRHWETILGKTVTNKSIDTLTYARRCFDSSTSCSLQNLSIYFGFDTEGEHRSVADCYLTKAVFEQLEKMPPDGSAHGIEKYRKK